MDGLRPLGYQRITSLGSSSALTIPAGTCEVHLMAETQDVRMGMSSNVPTATNGLQLKATATLASVFSHDLTDARFIEAVAGGVLNAYYFGK